MREKTLRRPKRGLSGVADLSVVQAPFRVGCRGRFARVTTSIDSLAGQGDCEVLAVRLFAKFLESVNGMGEGPRSAGHSS